MKNKFVWAKIFTISGTILLLSPIVLMLATSIPGSIMSGQLMMDYLLPAELGIFILIGSFFLLAGSIISHIDIKKISLTLGATLITIFSGQGIAMITGLASGRREAEGIFFTLVILSIIIFDLLVLLQGINGIIIIKKIFKSKKID